MSSDDLDELDDLSEAPSTLDTMDGLLAGVASAPVRVPPPNEGSKIGRYVLLQRVGAGAMGVVWAAYDPQLDRKVALKILRRDARAHGSDSSERAGREARALAKLVHPNIVAVHDGGLDGGAVYVVMEFVDGVTLRGWLAERARSLDEILDVFRQAGAGLAAAHDATLVHRDFKPDNALVGSGGRVCVADFGLAQIAGTELPAAATGGFVGTLAYMAPEQMDRAVVDHRADQFAFAVSLWAAIYGAPAFEGEGLAARRAAITAGPPAPPADRAVPAWLHAIVRRALADRPDDRYPSMRALLAAIEHGRGRRRRILSGVAVVVAIGGLVPLVWAASTRSQAAAAEPCAAGDAEIGAVWSTERAEAIAAAFPSTPGGAQAAAALRSRLDEYAGSWATAHREACRATRVDRSQSEDMLDRRMGCLSRARIRFDAVVAWLAGAGPAGAEGGGAAVDELPWLGRCEDVGALGQLEAEPSEPAARARLHEAMHRLAALKAEIYDPEPGDLTERSQAALDEARAAGWSPLLAEAAWVHGEALWMADRSDDAIGAYQEAVRVSLDAGDDLTAAFAMSDLARALAAVAEAKDARLWIGLARAMAHRSGVEGEVAANVGRSAALVAVTLGDFEEAIAESERTVELVRQTVGDRDDHYGAELGNLGMVLLRARRYERARETLERGIAVREAALGAGHPTIGAELRAWAMALMELGRLDEATVTMERALMISEGWYGKDSLNVALALQHLALVHQRLGNLESATTSTRRALEIFNLRDPGSSMVPMLEANLGMFEAVAGRHDAAIEHGRRALAALEAQVGPGDPRVLPVLVLLGRTERLRGQHQASAPYLQRAVAVAESFGPSHPWTGNTRVELALTDIALGQLDAAIALCERVIADAEADEGFSPSTRAEARITLADALWREGRDRKRARRVATDARDRYAAMGGGYEASVAEAQRWLDEHP